LSVTISLDLIWTYNLCVTISTEKSAEKVHYWHAINKMVCSLIHCSNNQCTEIYQTKVKVLVCVCVYRVLEQRVSELEGQRVSELEGKSDYMIFTKNQLFIFGK
jgi:hypothetical protein